MKLKRTLLISLIFAMGVVVVIMGGVDLVFAQEQQVKGECEILWTQNEGCAVGLVAEEFFADDIIVRICRRVDGGSNCTARDSRSYNFYCGDGKCTKSGDFYLEDVENCPADCTGGNEHYNLSNGRNAEIKILPETASERAVERLGNLGFNITLKEVGKGDKAKVVYELTGNKEGKFLGIFKIMAKVQAQVDAETGEVKIIKPWWAFLAKGI